MLRMRLQIYFKLRQINLKNKIWKQAVNTWPIEYWLLFRIFLLKKTRLHWVILIAINRDIVSILNIILFYETRLNSLKEKFVVVLSREFLISISVTRCRCLCGCHPSSSLYNPRCLPAVSTPTTCISVLPAYT